MNCCEKKSWNNIDGKMDYNSVYIISFSSAKEPPALYDIIIVHLRNVFVCWRRGNLIALY